MTIQITVKNEQETDILGRVLANALPDGAVVSLLGTLGAGKTRFAQAIAAASGVPVEDIASPTFVLVKEYQGAKRKIYHFDAYRLRNSNEFLELGADEYFDDNGISLVEWADKVADVMPEDRLEISITPISEISRRFAISAKGGFDPNFEEALLERWTRASTPRLK